MRYVPPEFVNTTPVLDTIFAVRSPSCTSVAIAPASTYVPHCSTYTGVVPRSVISGLSPEFTVTFRMTVAAVFPDPSVTLYVTVYAPAVAVFTLFTVMILGVISPSSGSVAVAPESTYTDHDAITIDALPESVITGIPPDTTFTVRVTVVPTFPAASVLA